MTYLSNVKPTNGKRSKFEAELEESMPEDAVYEPCRLSYPIKTKAHYIPDWILPTQCIVIEAKGYFPSETRTKMLRVKLEYPYLDIRFIFRRDDKLSKTMRVSQWCERNEFPVAFGTKIPKEWLEKVPSEFERSYFNEVLNIKE